MTDLMTVDGIGTRVMAIRFGSALYGTATPASDTDIKGIHIPRNREILLGTAAGSLVAKREKAHGERNTAEDVDFESYSLKSFFKHAADGQTVALDMLFAPASAHLVAPNDLWIEILQNRHRLVSKKAAPFVGYCKQQSNKYGIKGSRIAAARGARSLFDEAISESGSKTRVFVMDKALRAYAAVTEHTAIVPIEQPSGMMVDHFEVCGRKIPYTSQLGEAFAIVDRIVNEAGKRALQAESNQGVDWKALSHAVRVGHQAIELFDTGHITFPLPNLDRIMAIKLGQVPYREVAEEIEALLPAVEAAAERSSLPDEPDRAWMDDFVSSIYGASVAGRALQFDPVFI